MYDFSLSFIKIYLISILLGYLDTFHMNDKLADINDKIRSDEMGE